MKWVNDSVRGSTIEASDEPGTIRFGATLPSAGRYRLFLQFKHDGVVRTVAHTLVVPG